MTTPTTEQLSKVEEAFTASEEAVGACWNGRDYDLGRLKEIIEVHLMELALHLEQHDLGGRMWKALEAFKSDS